ncbi:alkaline phosphatase D family protein [Horticoccus sp. 23ND18S-11]|uniref:alkaline phosphatase D family protein n=1 Tax=Horticoccus sp. 23ND18S-11 TaxID=3391832 RepID=UPI0039C93580
MSSPLFPLPSAPTFSRRAFVAGTASFAAAAWLSSSRLLGAVTGSPRFAAYPFSLGIASGDPAPDSVVLWTRLAPKPLEPGGGMRPEPVEVSWVIAEDEALAQVVRSGTAVANPAWGHSVHVEAGGLRPDRWYWYQFKAGGETSPKGRTRTLPAADVLPARLRFAFASCQHYETGLFTAYQHLAREDLDLIVHLGDYIYEGAVREKQVRRHNGPEIMTVDDYRARYALYKLDPALQAAHAAAPWIVTWDDHEVANNYAGDIPARPGPRDEFLRRRAAAYQAYYEMMPLRPSALPSGPDMLLYRRLGFGRLASFNVLDTRQYRTDQPQGDGRKPASPVLMDPKGTLLGAKQREWLSAGLERSAATWNVLAQQVMMARVDLTSGPKVDYSMDQWPGYEFERRRVLRHFHDHKIRNPIVLTGDIHTHWANELIADFDQLDSRNVGVEFVGTSISSGGDGSPVPQGREKSVAENPFVKFLNGERGYVTCEVTPRQWTTAYKTVPYVSRPGAPLHTRATFVVDDGRPVLQRA